MNALITGNSSGIGLGLTQALLDQSASVYGVSRRGCPMQHETLHDVQADLTNVQASQAALSTLLKDVEHLDLVVLNAGVVGQIAELSETPLEDLRQTMDVNLWSNKTVLDQLLSLSVDVRQIVFMSSGVAVNGSRGWGGYALSKAALNMMAQLYAHEFPGAAVNAFAPGVIDTAMQDYLCDQVSDSRYDSLKMLRSARGTAMMPKAEQAGPMLLRAFEGLQGFASGAFIDIRQLGRL